MGTALGGKEEELIDFLTQIGEPTCARCSMPVERFEFDITRDGNIHFTAMCHGDVETVSFTLEEFQGFKEIEFAPAFAGKH